MEARAYMCVYVNTEVELCRGMRIMRGINERGGKIVRAPSARKTGRTWKERMRARGENKSYIYCVIKYKNG